MNYDMTVGDGLVVYDGPAAVNGYDVESVRLWFPLLSKDMRLRWTAIDGVESLDQTELVFEHPQLGACHAEGFVLDTVGFGTVDSTVIGDSTVLVDYVTSGWVNLPILGSTHDPFDHYSTVMVAAGWKVGFSPIQPFNTREKDVRREGIPVYVSHQSVLSRVDGARFSANEAVEALHAFQMGLSFALGRFVSPIAPSGYGDDKLCWILTPAWFCDEGLGREGIIFPLDGEDFVDATASLANALLTGPDAASIRYLAVHAVVAHTAGLVNND